MCFSTAICCIWVVFHFILIPLLSVYCLVFCISFVEYLFWFSHSVFILLWIEWKKKHTNVCILIFCSTMRRMLFLFLFVIVLLNNRRKKNYNNNNDLWRVVYFTIQKPRVSFIYPYTHTHTHIYTMNNKKVQSPQKRKLNELLFTKYTTEKQRQKLKRR